MMAWQSLCRAGCSCQESQTEGAVWRQIDYLADRKDRIQRGSGARLRASFQEQPDVGRCGRAPGTGRGRFPAWAAQP